MEKVGVMAVVEGLSSFVGDIGKMNSAMDSLKPQGNMLTSLFAGVGNALSSFGREILNVAEVALGALLARAIEFVIGKLRELISTTLEAGAEFQILRLRLNRLNFNDALESSGDYEAATHLATVATKEQLTWLQKLAVLTPYDAQDIANVFTLARSYGFAAESAKSLTGTIVDFASGMGLGEVEIKRIIVNFGQMVQQGKVTQREMNDLARGAFVPVNDVLIRMQQNIGKTGKEFDKFRSTGAGVQSFFVAFTEIVEERFKGAAEQMARTFSGASANAQDFIKSLIGFNVVTPILDVVGGKIADFVSALTEEGNWNTLNQNASVFGTILSGLVSDLLGGGLDPQALVDKLVGGFQKLGAWILENKPKILEFFQSIKDKIPEVKEFLAGLVTKFNEWKDWFVLNKPAIDQFFTDIGVFIEEKVKPFVDALVEAFNKISAWVTENKPTIDEFFTTLGEILGLVFDKLGGDLDTGGVDGFLEAITGFMNYVIENKETIAEFIANLMRLAAIFTVVGVVLGILMGIFTAIITPIIAVVSVIAGLFAIITLLANPISWLIILIGILVVQLIANWQYVVMAFEYLKQVIIDWAVATWEAISTWAINVWNTITTFFTDMKTAFLDGANALGETFIQMWNDLLIVVGTFVLDMANAITSFDWGQLGSDIMQGLADGIRDGITWAVGAAQDAAEAVAAALQNAMGIQSPSKLFAKFGRYTMQGFAQGITDNAKLAEAAMMGAVGQITAPVLNMPAITQQYAMATGPSVNNQNSYTNNWNLTVNSSANTEPIIQDYNMLQSLAGV